MGFDITITVYNRLYDRSAGYDEYYMTIIEGCSWYSEQVTLYSSGEKIFTRKNVHKIRIPDVAQVRENKEYTTPADYTAPEAQYTLQEGDKIIKGVGMPITRPDQMQGKYGDICTITAVHDNRRTGLKNLYVEGT